MKAAILGLFKILPFLFGIGFIGPLISQSMHALSWDGFLGLPNLAIGILIGGVWGAITVKTGRWI